MRVGILTGCGVVPGLYPCIKAVVTRAEENGWEVVGIRRGWAGLLNYNPAEESVSATEWIEPLTRRSVRTIDRYGGTHLHTSRTNPQNVRVNEVPDFLRGSYKPAEGASRVDCTRHVLGVLDHLKIDTLIPIGGDDTLSFALRLQQEGVPVVAIPKTMDNDVHGTHYSIGL